MGHKFKLLNNTLSDENHVQFDEITNVFDKWILSKLDNLCTMIDDDMQNYRLNKAVDKQLDFIEDLVNWYIKFNRKRMKGEYGVTDWSNAISVLHFVIHTFARVCSPTTPFLSEYVHRHLYTPYINNYPSIHLMPYPQFESMFDEKLDRTFKYLKLICESVRSMRDKTEYHRTIKMPINKCIVYHDDEELLNMLKNNIKLVHEEINCIDVEYHTLCNNLNYSLEPNFREIGKLFGKDTKKVVTIIKTQTSSEIKDLGNNSIIKDNFNIPSNCFTIKKSPIITDSSLNVNIIDDMMIGVDFVLNERVKEEYIVKYLHSCIQNTRKEMNLHLWNRVNIIIDNGINKVINDLDERLNQSLSNSTVIWNNDNSYEFKHTINIKLDGNNYTISYDIIIV